MSAVLERSLHASHSCVGMIAVPLCVCLCRVASAPQEVIAPVAVRFAPDIILVSAGYDAHWRRARAPSARRTECRVRFLFFSALLWRSRAPPRRPLRCWRRDPLAGLQFRGSTYHRLSADIKALGARPRTWPPLRFIPLRPACVSEPRAPPLPPFTRRLQRTRSAGAGFSSSWKGGALPPLPPSHFRPWAFRPSPPASSTPTPRAQVRPAGLG